MTRRLFLSTAMPALAQKSAPVNLILILTDNHGPHTLGCYGNPDIRTPNIDRLAKEGALFENAFACNAVCSPTRASLLTGLMPSQHGVHTYLPAGGAQIGPQAYNTIGELVGLPRILTSNGYVAGLTGKWHLGGNLHAQDGFTYWVTKPHGHSPGFYDQEVIEDGRIRKEPGYLTDFWTDHALRFLEQHHQRPFFLFLAYNGPYGLGTAVQEQVRNRHAGYYADKELPSMPRDAPHPWQFNNRDFMNLAHTRRKYAAELSGIDDGVGRVMEALKRFGLERNTLVVFTADQGLATGQSGFWGMGDHTRPLTAFDWTMRVPLIFHCPGIVPTNRHKTMVGTCDLLPTMLDLLGLADRLPSSPPRSGSSLRPLLSGGKLSREEEIYFEFENVRAIRNPKWKYIERFRQSPNELYDMQKDPGERLNLYGLSEYEATQTSLRERLRAFFDRYADPKWDLWNGGRSKAPLLSQKGESPVR
jgi:arylsulfatase A-like enzyme